MDALKLRQVYIDQQASFKQHKCLIDRDIDLIPYLQTRQVVVITGVRRCGKSSLLYLLKQQLKLQDEACCYFNFDDERIMHETTLPEQIYLLHLELYQTEPIFFFDEVQNIPGWERFVNRMYEKRCKLFVTGSNAKLLSSEVASSLTGRNKTLSLFPFSFGEFLSFKGQSYAPGSRTSEEISLLQSDVEQYMQLGGFPTVIQENDLTWINQYFQDILYRDIVARYRITQVAELRQMALFLASNVGKLFSYSTLQRLSGLKSTQSVKSYVDYLEQSYLFVYLRKFDYSVKKQIMSSRKVYAIDPAFCNHLGFRFSENQGRVLENIVYLQLLRHGKQVYYYQGKRECDFVIQQGLKVVKAIQVVYALTESNFRREIEGLTEAMDTFDLSHGLLITRRLPIGMHLAIPDNIQVIPAWEWLLQGDGQ